MSFPFPFPLPFPYPFYDLRMHYLCTRLSAHDFYFAFLATTRWELHHVLLYQLFFIGCSGGPDHGGPQRTVMGFLFSFYACFRRLISFNLRPGVLRTLLCSFSLSCILWTYCMSHGPFFLSTGGWCFFLDFFLLFRIRIFAFKAIYSVLTTADGLRID